MTHYTLCLYRKSNVDRWGDFHDSDLSHQIETTIEPICKRMALLEDEDAHKKACHEPDMQFLVFADGLPIFDNGFYIPFDADDEKFDWLEEEQNRFLRCLREQRALMSDERKALVAKEDEARRQQDLAKEQAKVAAEQEMLRTLRLKYPGV